MMWVVWVLSHMLHLCGADSAHVCTHACNWLATCNDLCFSHRCNVYVFCRSKWFRGQKVIFIIVRSEVMKTVAWGVSGYLTWGCASHCVERRTESFAGLWIVALTVEDSTSECVRDVEGERWLKREHTLYPETQREAHHSWRLNFNYSYIFKIRSNWEKIHLFSTFMLASVFSKEAPSIFVNGERYNPSQPVEIELERPLIPLSQC